MSGPLPRLLALVPYLLARPGVRVAEVAEVFGVSEERLRKDLNLLWVCGLPGYGPGDLIDMAFDGDRVTITAGGIIHDMRCDGTEANGVNDVAEFDKATPITVVATFDDGVHVLRPVGIPIEVKRWRDGDDLMWQYVGVTCRLTRID